MNSAMWARVFHPPAVLASGASVLVPDGFLMDTTAVVDDLKTGKFVWYKFDAPDNWVICKLTKIVSNSQDFNCMVRCCADNDTYKVFLNQGLYTAAPSIDSPSSSWCWVKKKILPPAGYEIVNKSMDQATVVSGCLSGCDIMFKWNVGWSLSKLVMFLGSSSKFNYVMEDSLSHEQHKVNCWPQR